MLFLIVPKVFLNFSPKDGNRSTFQNIVVCTEYQKWIKSWNPATLINTTCSPSLQVSYNLFVPLGLCLLFQQFFKSGTNIFQLLQLPFFFKMNGLQGSRLTLGCYPSLTQTSVEVMCCLPKCKVHFSEVILFTDYESGSVQFELKKVCILFNSIKSFSKAEHKM